MSLTRVTITNFQSLKDVDLDLGVFTVIVGPSSSGKSALIRAFKALASNVRGSGVITRGQKQMAITGRTETHTVTLERAEKSGQYRISDDQGSNLTYTKLAGEVPEHVTAALRIDPVGDSGSVNFASQFDKPYLLDESGATVARALGELTGVTTIFQAVRSANAIRLDAAKKLKMRKSDLEQVKTRLAEFTGLSDRVKALERAEELDVRRRDVEARIGRLDVAVRTLRITETAIERNNVPDVPSADPLNAVMNRYLDLQAALRGLAEKQKRLAAAEAALDHATRLVVIGEEVLAQELVEAGVCPTCGQKVH